MKSSLDVSTSTRHKTQLLRRNAWKAEVSANFCHESGTKRFPTTSWRTGRSMNLLSPRWPHVFETPSKPLIAPEAHSIFARAQTSDSVGVGIGPAPNHFETTLALRGLVQSQGNVHSHSLSLFHDFSPALPVTSI